MILKKGAKRVRNELDIVQFIKNQFQTTSLLQRVVKASVRKQHQKEGKRIITSKDLEIDSDLTNDGEMEKGSNINRSMQADDNIGNQSMITAQITMPNLVEAKLKKGNVSGRIIDGV